MGDRLQGRRTGDVDGGPVEEPRKELEVVKEVGRRRTPGNR